MHVVSLRVAFMIGHVVVFFCVAASLLVKEFLLCAHTATDYG
jgi:hypothetical protein